MAWLRRLHGLGPLSVILIFFYSTAIIRTCRTEIVMAQMQANRDDRIELRTTRDEKRLLTAAAAHERLDVTSFIMRAVLPAAREVVENAERISLSERDSLRVLDLLENPPAPTPALLAAARRRIARDGKGA